MGFAVVLDTCTLYPAHLRDALLRLAELDLFDPLWSDDILNELSEALATSGIPPSAIQHLIEEMQGAFPEAFITGYRSLVDSMVCPDPADRHVLAAAVRANAGAIVTYNLKDFPPEVVNPYEIEVIHPDGFLLDLLDLAPVGVINSIRRQAEANRHSPRTVEEILDALSKVGVNDFAETVRSKVRFAQEMQVRAQPRLYE